MADEKKILVVDDHFEMLEFLRSMLELSNEDYEVLAVPSAEEGLMELRRTHFDLVITDVRLPGMSGFDLARQTRAIKSSTPIIMITAYSSSQGRKEAEELGVFRYFGKPLDTDEMLSAVHKALYGESVVLAPPKKAGPALVRETAVSNRVHKRLEALRTDTGAAQLSLAKTSGEIVLQIGNGRFPNTAKLIRILTKTLHDSFLLAQELGNNKKPFTIQYHAGKKTELYMMNVGHDYFLAMFFDVQARRGRIGTIWVFAQRAIKELLELLPAQARAAAKPIKTAPLPTQPALEIPAKETPKTAVPPKIPPDNLTDDLLPEPDPENADWIDVDPEELAALLADETTPPADTGDLNTFWNEALNEANAKSTVGAVSWEEAQRQGLIPSKLDFDDSEAEK